MVDALEIGYAIKDRRAQLGLTQSAVAEAAGVSSRSVWSLELGRNDGVQLNKLLAVFEVLGLDLRIEENDMTKSRNQAASTDSINISDYVQNGTLGTKSSIGFDPLAILTGQDQ